MSVVSPASLPPDLFQYKAGLYYCAPGSLSTFNPADGTARIVPFYLPTRRAIDRIGVEVTAAGAAGSLYRLLIYEDAEGPTAGGYPGALLLNAGTVDTSVLGLREATVSQEVGPGLIWLSGVPQGGVAVPSVRVLGSAFIPFSVGQVTPGAGNSGYQATGITGAPPAEWTAVVANGGSTPAIWLRFT